MAVCGLTRPLARFKGFSAASPVAKEVSSSPPAKRNSDQRFRQGSANAVRRHVADNSCRTRILTKLWLSRTHVLRRDSCRSGSDQLQQSVVVTGFPCRPKIERFF